MAEIRTILTCISNTRGFGTRAQSLCAATQARTILNPFLINLCKFRYRNLMLLLQVFLFLRLGTHDIHALILGRAITGIPSF